MLWHWPDCSKESGEKMWKTTFELVMWHMLSWLPKQCFSLSNVLICIIGHFTSCKVVKIATFLWTTESIASDFSLVITNISKIELLDTNFGFRFLGFYLTKMLHFGIWVQVKSTFQMSNFISMVIFWLYSSFNALNGMLLIINTGL